MRFLLALLASACLSSAHAANWQLSWSDEFNSAAGTKPDPSKWNYDLGGGGFGNGELECYTNRVENVRQDGKGNLVIEARKEKIKDAKGAESAYSSGRLLTKGKFTQAFGRFEARMKIPQGKGMWPAFWLLGDDIDRSSWPTCGEIDVMENIGHELFTSHGTIHGPGYNGANGIGAAWEAPGHKKLADDFHIYAIDWEPEAIRWYVDGNLFETRSPKDLGGRRWVYDHPFFMLLNLAVGGGWPGSPDSATKFPQSMLIDYVRVYRDTTLNWNEGKLKAKRDQWAADAKAYEEVKNFKGVKPVTLPGRIQAELYAEGGEGKAYHDLDDRNEGNEYRKDGVDIQLCSDEGAGVNVGWTHAGEWLEYDVATNGGRFRVKARAACMGAGGSLGFSFNGKEFASIKVGDTGGWQTWKTFESSASNLPKGAGRLRVTMMSEGPVANSTGNFNWFEFEAVK